MATYRMIPTTFPLFIPTSSDQITWKAHVFNLARHYGLRFQSIYLDIGIKSNSLPITHSVIGFQIQMEISCGINSLSVNGSNLVHNAIETESL